MNAKLEINKLHFDELVYIGSYVMRFEGFCFSPDPESSKYSKHLHKLGVAETQTPLSGDFKICKESSKVDHSLRLRSNIEKSIHLTEKMDVAGLWAPAIRIFKTF